MTCSVKHAFRLRAMGIRGVKRKPDACLLETDLTRFYRARNVKTARCPNKTTGVLLAVVQRVLISVSINDAKTAAG